MRHIKTQYQYDRLTFTLLDEGWKVDVQGEQEFMSVLIPKPEVPELIDVLKGKESGVESRIRFRVIEKDKVGGKTRAHWQIESTSKQNFHPIICTSPVLSSVTTCRTIIRRVLENLGVPQGDPHFQRVMYEISKEGSK